MSQLEPPRVVGIVFALPIEAGGTVDLLSGLRVTRAAGFTVRQGQRGGRSVVLIESGVGRDHAARATHALIDAHRPRRVFSAGFAGALDADLRRGDLVVADRLIDAQGRQWTAGPDELPPWLAGMQGLRVGRLLTFDRVVATPAEKRALGQEHQALAVDMESLAVAEVCRERGVPFLAVRVISDTIDDEIPPEIEKLLAQKSTAGKFGAALGSLWRRPSSVKDMLRLQQQALAASDRLAQFLDAAIHAES
jgi:adenosylhomocysteine nucleosidase